MEHILIPFFPVRGEESYPAGVEQIIDAVTLDGIEYLTAYGDVSLQTGQHTYADYEASLNIPTVPITNITISPSKLVGNIYWVRQAEPFTVTGDLPLPDGEMMVVVPKVIDGSDPVDDKRFIAHIVNGKVTINCVFNEIGNYLITAKRLNEGLERIGAPFRLEFDTIEFDAYYDV